MKRFLSLLLILCICLPQFGGLIPYTRAATTLTYEEIIEAAEVVKLNMDEKILPNAIPAGNITITPGQFEYLSCHVLIGLHKGTTKGSVTVIPVAEAPNPFGSAKGQVTTADLATMAAKIIPFIETNGYGPNYSTSSAIGQMCYFDVVNVLARALYFYDQNGRLPNYCTSEVWKGSYGENILLHIPGLDQAQTQATTCLYQLPAKYPRASGDYYQNMSYVVKTRQGKIIVIDGGYKTGDYDPKYLYAFLQEVTGKSVPHVDAWFFTHNHNDHYGAFLGIANLYPNGITVDTIYHRFPTADEINTYFSGDKPADRVTALTYIPNAAKKLKNAQGGAVKIETLNSVYSGKCNAMLDFDEVHIDVLLTCEDLFQECDTDTAKYSGTLANAATPAFSNKTLKSLVSTNFNESSTVFRMTVPGKTILITGDAAFACGVVLQKYHKANAADHNQYFSLKSDIVQVSHHGQAGLQKAVYTAIDPDVALWPAPSWVYNAAQSATNVRTYYARQWFTALGTTNYVSYNGPHTFKYGVIRSANPVSIPESVKPFVFDPQYYADAYADLKNAYGTDEGKLYEHFVNYGIEEGRSASPYFDVKFYMNQNGQNFRETMKGDYEKAFHHFLTNGNTTIRMKLSETFDAAYYASRHPELGEQGITTEWELLDHYISEGRKKNEPASHTFLDPSGVGYHSNCTIMEGTEPTCTGEGTSWGARCDACGIILVSQTTLPKTNHTYIYTDKGEKHTVGCTTCSYEVLEEHSFVNGLCICNHREQQEPTVDESIVINHTLNLASDISVNFAIKADLLQDYENHFLVCEIPVYEGNTQVGTKKQTIIPTSNGNYYYYTLMGLTAVQMGDVVTAQLHMEKNGREYISTVDTYSVAQYAYSQLNKAGTASSLKALCADLLRYGKEAQIFKGYRTDSPVDGAMTEVHRSYLSNVEDVTFGNHNETLADIENPSVTWVGKSLDLDSKVAVKYVFTPVTYEGDIADLSLRVHYVNYKGELAEVWISQAEVYDSAKNRYAFTFDGLLAAELRTVVEVAVFCGDAQLSQTLRYSPDTYGNNRTGQLLTLCKALFAYSDTAKIYFQQ